MNGEVEISVVIPARNEEQFLMLCLESIEKAFGNHHAYEIIVVDNDSTDNTVKIAKNAGCKVFQNKKMSAGSSRNIGASIAKGNFIAFIDADCVINEKWLRLTKEHFSNTNVVAVGTKVCPDFDNASWVEKSVFRLNKRRGIDISSKAIKVKWIGTSNILLRKDAFDAVNGFDENLITCEDYDLCERLSVMGDIMLDKRVYSIHLRESRSLKDLFCRELWRGQDSFKHWGKSGYRYYEAPSIILPAFFLICFALVVFTTFLNFKIAITFLFFMFTCSTLMVLRSRNRLLNPILFGQCVVIASVYLLARGVALVKEFVRTPNVV